jgi:cobalt/nickel transport system permease protein
VGVDQSTHAMHVPDGFLTAPTSVVTMMIAGLVVALALHRVGRRHPAGPSGSSIGSGFPPAPSSVAPMAGLAAAFIFAAQMVNVPVGLGTSGHLVGGALAAVLLGPGTAILVMTVVVGVQALLFADGGLTAIGTNTLLMAVVAVGVGWVVARGTLRVLGNRRNGVVIAAAAGAFVSVPAAALVFALLFGMGGAVDLPWSGLLVTMLLWHVLIAVPEAAITAVVVGAVMASRPDLVALAGSRRQQLVLDPDGELTEAGRPDEEAGAPAPRRPVVGFVAVGLLVSLSVGGLLGAVASSSPDGLERVAAETGLDVAQEPHPWGDLPLAEYGEVGGIPLLVVAALGVLAAAAVSGFLVWSARAASRGSSGAGPVATDDVVGTAPTEGAQPRP